VINRDPIQSGKSITDINVTPMVDIMMVLLIIFMVTATYITRNAIPLQLPEAASGSDVPVTTLAIAVQPDGALILNGEATTLDQIRSLVPGIIAANPDVQALIGGDQAVNYGRVMEVIDTLRTLGVKRFAAEVQRKER